MPRHHGRMPPIPPASRSPKGAGGDPEIEKDTSSKLREHYAEQGDTANIRENTTNEGYFQGRRIK